MPQMMPLWWLINLFYTNLMLNFYISLIHSINFTYLKKNLYFIKKNKLHFQW